MPSQQYNAVGVACKEHLGSRWVGFLPPFCCVSAFPHDISETDAARIAKLDTEMFHDEYWKPTYIRVRRSKVKVTNHQKRCRRGSLHSCECWHSTSNLLWIVITFSLFFDLGICGKLIAGTTKQDEFCLVLVIFCYHYMKLWLRLVLMFYFYCISMS